MRDREGADDSKKILMANNLRKKQFMQYTPFTCHFCKKPGHFKKDCKKFALMQSNDRSGKPKNPSHQPSKREQQPSQDAMLISHALLQSFWAEAISTATYMSLTSAVEGMTLGMAGNPEWNT